MPPKGKRRSNALVTRDAFELLRLVDGEGMLIDDAMKQLKLSRSRAYDLLGRARSAVLRSQNEANKKASEVNTKRWYEATPEPPPEEPFEPVVDRGGQQKDLHDISSTSREPESIIAATEVNNAFTSYEPWEWEHLKPYREFISWPEHRRKQWLAQVHENEALGGVRWTPVLRGKPSNQGVCFNPNHSQFNCDCHSEGPFTV